MLGLNIFMPPPFRYKQLFLPKYVFRTTFTITVKIYALTLIMYVDESDPAHICVDRTRVRDEDESDPAHNCVDRTRVWGEDNEDESDPAQYCVDRTRLRDEDDEDESDPAHNCMNRIHE